MPREKLIGQEVAPQHPRECPGRNARIHIAKSAFLDAAVDQLLDQSNEPADKLLVERIGQCMVFKRAVVVEPQKDRIEGLGEPRATSRRTSSTRLRQSAASIRHTRLLSSSLSRRIAI